MQISKHFNMQEVVKSQSAIRLGIDNSLPDELYEYVIDVAENILEPVREFFNAPVRVSSWYRSPALNKAIGGSKTSDHCFGCAVDFEVDGISNKQVAIYIRDNLKFKQLILEFYTSGKPNSGWVHCSYLEGRNTNEVLKTSDGKNYKTGL